MVSPGNVALTLFGIDIMWYGILMSAAILIGATVTYIRAPRHGIESESVLDILLWAVPIAVVGSRLYYVAFRWEYYAQNPTEIINLRGGGLAIHGALIAAFIVVFFVCRHKGIRTINALDLGAPGIALAQSIGRWGNFFNEEAHGTVTDFPIAVVIDGVSYHATFLYESVWCFLLFLFLIWRDNRRMFCGQTICLYGMIYSFERFFVEYLRTDSLMIGPFRQAMVFSACVFALCLVLYFILRAKTSDREELWKIIQ